MLGGDARARVRHTRLDPAVVQPTAHDDATFWRREPHGVVEEDPDYLSRPLRVSTGRELAGGLDLETDLLVGRPDPEALCLFREDRGEIKGLSGQVDLAGVQPGDQEEIREYCVHAFGLGECVLHQFPVLLVQRPPVEHHLCVGPNEGERRLEFVGGVGYERSLPLEGLARRTHGPAGHVEAAEEGGPKTPERQGQQDAGRACLSSAAPL